MSDSHRARKAGVHSQTKQVARQAVPWPRPHCRRSRYGNADLEARGRQLIDEAVRDALIEKVAAARPEFNAEQIATLRGIVGGA